MSTIKVGPVPEGPVDIHEVIRRFPTLRQSLLAKHDDCPLSTHFELRYANGWSTHPQARGTMFHRFAAEFLRTLRQAGHTSMPVAEALEILVEVCRQRDIEPADIVRVPLHEMKDLRMAAIKFANDNSFSIEKIVDIEQRLSATVQYDGPGGELIERVVTGQLDAILFAPPDGCVVLDWKDTWGLPPEPRDPQAPQSPDDELRGISYHGYFQQRLYGWLVMKNYANVNSVTLREFYVRKTKVRKATLHRDKLHEVERDIIVLVEAFDRAMASGAPTAPYGRLEDGSLDIDSLGHWKPQPGKHCGFCVRKGECPIEGESRGVGAIENEAQARQYAAEMVVSEEIREDRREACKVWVETTGSPIPLKGGKGRRVLGWHETPRGRRFEPFTPDASDRGGHPADLALREAMRESTARARRERDTAKRKARR